MGKYIEKMEASIYSYGRFESELNKYLKQNKMTAEDFSVDILVRSPNYLKDSIRKRVLPMNCFVAACKAMGKETSYFKIPKEAPAPVVMKEPVEVKEWDIRLLVNKEFGFVRTMLMNGAETVAIGNADIDGKHEADVIKAITVAIGRMNAKLIPGQQSTKQEVKPEPPKQEAKPEPLKAPEDNTIGRKTFKEWIMRYYDSHSDAGRLARFIDEHYEEFPSWGQVKMQRFLQLTQGGAAHRVTLDAYFDHYRKQQQAEERANSQTLKNGVMRSA